MRRPARLLVCCGSLALVAACGLAVAGGGEPSTPTAAASQRAGSAELAVDLEHDAMGNLTRVERASGVTTFGYDALGRPVRSIDALSGETSMSFTAADGVSSAVDARGVATAYERDGFGSLTRRASADTGETRREYDAAGNLVSSVDARGVTTLYGRDALDRLTQVTHRAPGSPGEVFTWTYDDSLGGVLVAAAFPGGSSSWTYDALGRPSSETLRVGGSTLVTAYQYDASTGHVVSIRYPSGRSLELSWVAGVPVALTVAGNDGGSTPVVDQLELDALGSPARWRWRLESGVTRLYERTRDAAGRPSRYPIGAGWRELSYDAAGRITRYSHPNSGLDESFSYDGLDRVVGYTRQGASHTVSYDATGNRTAVDGTTWSVAPASHRLLSRTDPAGTTAFTFDAAGNLVGDGRFSAEYDLAGRMARLTRGGVTTTYVYDGSGRRVRKVGGAVDLRFVYDTDGRLLGEYDAAGAAVREYLWLGGTLIAFFQGAELFFVQTDHLGAPRVAFDTLGQERWRWLSGPFGDEPPAPGSVDLPLRFPGQYADSESGLFYNHFRYYDPAAGRYTQSDPVGLAGGVNTYAYAAGNPISATDRDGLTAGVLIGLGVRVVGGRAAVGALGRAAARFGMVGRIAACVLAGACSVDEPGPDADLPAVGAPAPEVPAADAPAEASHDETAEQAWPEEPQACAAPPDEPVGKLRRRDPKWLKDQGVEPHAEKENSRTDLYTDRDGNVWSIRKNDRTAPPEWVGRIGHL